MLSSHQVIQDAYSLYKENQFTQAFTKLDTIRDDDYAMVCRAHGLILLKRYSEAKLLLLTLLQNKKVTDGIKWNAGSRLVKIFLALNKIDKAKTYLEGIEKLPHYANSQLRIEFYLAAKEYRLALLACNEGLKNRQLSFLKMAKLVEFKIKALQHFYDSSSIKGLFTEIPAELFEFPIIESLYLNFCEKEQLFLEAKEYLENKLKAHPERKDLKSCLKRFILIENERSQKALADQKVLNLNFSKNYRDCFPKLSNNNNTSSSKSLFNDEKLSTNSILQTFNTSPSSELSEKNLIKNENTSKPTKLKKIKFIPANELFNPIRVSITESQTNPILNPSKKLDNNSCKLPAIKR